MKTFAIKLRIKALRLAAFVVFMAFLSCNKSESEVKVEEGRNDNSNQNAKCYSDVSSEKYTSTTGSGYKIAILMYHNIVDNDPIDEYDRKKSVFESDLKYLKSKGYQILKMEDLPLLKNGSKQLISNAVIITFDDGYASSYTKAFPLLKQYNMPATFFIVPEWMGSENYMTWSQIWIMSDYKNSKSQNIISIHSHTSSHPFLLNNKSKHTASSYQNFLNLQLGESKTWIQDVTGKPGMYLALPYGNGANDTAIINTAKRIGYNGIRTSIWGATSVSAMNLYALPSIPILAESNIKSIETYFR